MTDPTPASQRVAATISCVMPAYNEAGNLGLVVPRVLSALGQLSQQVELIIINDGSRDATEQVMADLCAKHPQVVALNLSRNFGKEPALTAGLEASSGEVVFILDADGQHPVDLLPEMLRKWEQGADVVYAVRKTRHDQSKLHIAFTSVFYKLINWRSRVKIPANAGDFRLMGRNVVHALQQLPERNRFMKGLYGWVGFDAVALPYTPEPRAHGETNFSRWRLIRLSLDGLTAFTTWPLRAVSVGGFGLALLAFLYGGYLTVDYLLNGNTVGGWTTIVVGLTLFSGIQLIAIGIAGEYIARIFEEVKARPLYVVKHDIGQGLRPPHHETLNEERSSLA